MVNFERSIAGTFQLHRTCPKKIQHRVGTDSPFPGLLENSDKIQSLPQLPMEQILKPHFKPLEQWPIKPNK